MKLHDLSTEEMLVTYRVEGEGMGPVTIDLHGRSWTPEEISAEVLKKLKRDAEAYFGEQVSRGSNERVSILARRRLPLGERFHRISVVGGKP